jgi:UDP-perosamine 4-acetyltransferase
VVVIGAGGHARVCLDLLLQDDDLDVVGCLGDAGTGQLQRPVVGTDDDLPGLRAQGVGHAFVAVGSNAARARLTRQATDLGFVLVSAVSPAATVAATARLGAGVAVMAGAVVNPYAEVGDGAVLNTGATVDHDCRVGAFAHVAPGVHLAGDCTVGEGALVGVGAVARPGTSVGDWAVVGAGAVLVADVPARTTVVGNPARVLA